MALKMVGLPITVVMIQMAFTVVFLCATPCSLHFGSLKVSHVMVPALYLHRMSCCLLLLCEDGFSYCPADPAAHTADPTFTVQFMTTGRAALGRHDTFPVYTHARIFDALHLTTRPWHAAQSNSSMIHPTLPTSECPIFADLKGAIVVLRNIAPMVTLAIEGFFGERVEINLPTVFSLVYILSGVALYVSTDVRTSPIGMAYMLLNMVSGVLERLLQRKMIALSPIDVSKTGMMLLNNAVSLILIVPLLF
eukprot:CAMPEP_0181179070 /NCGR_PEP_ID=MMETSP1096-20121128/6061_1 /TAXON_ID=156174 ORGANISM="Chrysochromulina ericina, Strain CCMP281" /NCGR_SAMPLE_ID=MMETSP1096 /ASSEMBLY_ACC=CAM_ASM_000453 /LENGTH=249 /DNA_ID=CAMNT_0023267389 /DNA_START=45 /DNA_END=790 /DNA_ORIENTATION=+